jgi:crotonobetainyl-CoA:carnitine CoA-transferase CaiB-like acyl-CoA transferase
LSDMLVLELSRALVGLHAAIMLGDLRARAIKLENPADGDDSRARDPRFTGLEGARESTYFLSCDGDKDSVKLDLPIEVGYPALGQVRLPGPPLRFDGSAQARHRPPLTPGQHTAGVLRWLCSGKRLPAYRPGN